MASTAACCAPGARASDGRPAVGDDERRELDGCSGPCQNQCSSSTSTLEADATACFIVVSHIVSVNGLGGRIGWVTPSPSGVDGGVVDGGAEDSQSAKLAPDRWRLTRCLSIGAHRSAGSVAQPEVASRAPSRSAAGDTPSVHGARAGRSASSPRAGDCMFRTPTLAEIFCSGISTTEYPCNGGGRWLDACCAT